MNSNDRAGLFANRRLRSPASKSDWSCQLHAAETPDARNTSGKRKPPPISTNCPRETITSRPAAIACSTSIVAAAQLLTTKASSAPGKLCQQVR